MGTHWRPKRDSSHPSPSLQPQAKGSSTSWECGPASPDRGPPRSQCCSLGDHSWGRWGRGWLNIGRSPMAAIHRYFHSFTPHVISTNSTYFHLTTLISLALQVGQIGSKGEISIQAAFPDERFFSFKIPKHSRKYKENPLLIAFGKFFPSLLAWEFQRLPRFGAAHCNSIPPQVGGSSSLDQLLSRASCWAPALPIPYPLPPLPGLYAALFCHL